MLRGRHHPLGSTTPRRALGARDKVDDVPGDPPRVGYALAAVGVQPIDDELLRVADSVVRIAACVIW